MECKAGKVLFLYNEPQDLPQGSDPSWMSVGTSSVVENFVNVSLGFHNLIFVCSAQGLMVR